jgi:SAM-dependent methyltransferase
MGLEMNNQVKQASAIRQAGRLAWRIAAKGKHMLFPRKDYVIHKGNLLPLPELRFNGPDYRNDEFFLASSIKEAKRVITELGYTPRDLLVDIGCGQGRLPIGLLAHDFGNAQYLGLDVSEASIQWCKRHIEKRYPSYRFQHVNLVNARYNPSGEPLPVDFHLPVASGMAHVIYMWGVVTNMEPEHLNAYACDIGRMLRRDGRLFLTANVEDNVPKVSINPENYTAFACHGPLHIVRYETQYFVEVFQRSGLALTAIAYHAAGNCQSELYFVKHERLDGRA